MITALLLLQLAVFSFTLWFGLYLFVRDSKKPGLRFAGLGLVAYALGLAGSVLVVRLLPSPLAAQWRIAPILLPSVFWMAATWYLQPESALPPRLNGSISMVLVATAAILVLFAALNPVIAQ